MINTLLLLRRRANSKNSTSTFSWTAISNLVKSKTGQSFGNPNNPRETYDAFVKMANSNPILNPDDANKDSIVANYDGNSVTIKTHAGEKPNMPPDSGKSAGSILPSAKRAAANILNR